MYFTAKVQSFYSASTDITNDLDTKDIPIAFWDLGVLGVFEGNRPILRVGDPELIKLILVRDFHVFRDRSHGATINHPLLELSIGLALGDQWQRIRHIVTPTFTARKMKLMYPL
ncbi:unnamed protein product, partial [Oppiella nova]